MSIPSEDIVRFILKDIVSDRKIRTQEELSKELLAKLRKNNPGYAMTGKRAREIALRTPGIHSKIYTRDGKAPSRCPACGGPLSRVYTRNLMGKKMLLRMSCKRCPYTGKENSWIPSRYEFFK